MPRDLLDTAIETLNTIYIRFVLQSDYSSFTDVAVEQDRSAPKANIKRMR
jgi:hypothetical protein